MTWLDPSDDPSDDPSHPSDVSRRSPVGFFADLYNRNGPDELVYWFFIIPVMRHIIWLKCDEIHFFDRLKCIENPILIHLQDIEFATTVGFQWNWKWIKRRLWHVYHTIGPWILFFDPVLETMFDPLSVYVKPYSLLNAMPCKWIKSRFSKRDPHCENKKMSCIKYEFIWEAC